MPEITISMAAGRTDEQKAGMMRDITQALVKNLGVDADAVVIQINEAPLAHKMKGGKTFVERGGGEEVAPHVTRRPRRARAAGPESAAADRFDVGRRGGGPMRRRKFLEFVAAPIGAGLMGPDCCGQTLSGKQIRVVVPFPAGGATDIVARPLAQMLGDALQATVVVDNRGGAGGSIGADNVAKSAPDGQSLLVGTVGTHAINPALYARLPYDAVRDFTPIALVALAPVCDRRSSVAADE